MFRVTNSQRNPKLFFHITTNLTLMIALTAVLGVSVFGQVAIWSGGYGTWFLPPNHPILELPNWSCLCEPNGPGFSVNIGTYTGTGGITGTVTLNMPANVAGVSLGNGAFGELDVVNGNTLTASNVVVVGATAAGRLNINSGGVVNNYNGAIGSLGSAMGTATVSGAGAQWNNSNDLSVGLNGRGTLTISGGGRVSSLNGTLAANTGSVGALTVSGPGSQWNSSGLVVIGAAGHGTLTIIGGGIGKSTRLGTSGGVSLGEFAGSSGTVTVSGAGSRWSTTAVFIGSGEGSGTLNIINGGVVDGSDDFFGSQIGTGGERGEAERWL